MVVIMIPNIIYAIKQKDSANAYRNKTVEIFEQIGRYGCFVFMIFNIPYTFMGFWFSNGLTLYLVINAALLFAYCLAWIILWKSNLVKALLLSVLPSVIFIFSGIMIASIPLLVFAVIFSVTHILISVKNADE